MLSKKNIQRKYRAKLNIFFNIYERREDYLSIKITAVIRGIRLLKFDYLVVNYNFEKEHILSPQNILKNYTHKINNLLQKTNIPLCFKLTPSLAIARENINITRDKIYFHFLPGQLGPPKCQNISLSIKSSFL